MNLTIHHLSKSYPNGVEAVKDVSLHIPKGMFGLLGPNGAGKSTLMRILATLQEPNTGEATLGDIDVLAEKDRVRRCLGYLPQEFGFYPKMKAEPLLDHFALLKGIVDKSERRETVAALLQRVNLWSARKKKLGEFSGGMKQRFGIALVLLGHPKLIIVDEPTAGLDPEERNRFLNLLSEIGEDVVVILSTHIVDDVSDLCTNMAIISDGEIRLTGKPADLIRELDGKIWMKTIDKRALDEHEQRYQIISTRLVGGRTHIHVFSPTQPDATFTSAPTSLEDVYFHRLTMTN